MTSLPPSPITAADLSACDREPIHIPGAVLSKMEIISDTDDSGITLLNQYLLKKFFWCHRF